MSYIGSSAAPMVQAFSGPFAEQFNGGVSSITLSRSVSKTTDITVVVNNVPQSPFDGSYSVSNKTLTLAETVSAGVGNIYVRYNDAPVASIAPIDGSVTYAKIQNVSAGRMLGRDTSGSGIVQELPIAVDVNGNVSFGSTTPLFPVNSLDVLRTSQGVHFNRVINPYYGSGMVLDADSGSANQGWRTVAKYVASGVTALSFETSNSTYPYSSNPDAGAITGYTERGQFDSNGNFKFNSGYGSAATAYGCRAWVKFVGNGSNAANATINGSGNVSSVYKNGTGLWTINFATAMPDANYCGATMSLNGGSGPYGTGVYNSGTPNSGTGQNLVRSTTQFGVGTQGAAGYVIDAYTIDISVFR